NQKTTEKEPASDAGLSPSSNSFSEYQPLSPSLTGSGSSYWHSPLLNRRGSLRVVRSPGECLRRRLSRRHGRLCHHGSRCNARNACASLVFHPRHVKRSSATRYHPRSARPGTLVQVSSPWGSHGRGVRTTCQACSVRTRSPAPTAEPANLPRGKILGPSVGALPVRLRPPTAP